MTTKKTAKQPASRAAVRLDPLVMHLIYGDIEEMPLEILGDECPTNEAYNEMDCEQSVRLAAAATVQAWIERRLHKNGYIWDEGRHPPEDLVHNDQAEPRRRRMIKCDICNGEMHEPNEVCPGSLGEPPLCSSDLLGDVGIPNETPLSGNILWEHPRVQAAQKELKAAAEAFVLEKQKWPKDTSFDVWMACNNRLENAAMTYGNTVREYRVS